MPCFSLQLPAAHVPFLLPLPRASERWVDLTQVTSLRLGLRVLAPHLSSLPPSRAPEFSSVHRENRPCSGRGEDQREEGVREALWGWEGRRQRPSRPLFSPAPLPAPPGPLSCHLQLSGRSVPSCPRSSCLRGPAPPLARPERQLELHEGGKSGGQGPSICTQQTAFAVRGELGFCGPLPCPCQRGRSSARCSVLGAQPGSYRRPARPRCSLPCPCQCGCRGRQSPQCSVFMAILEAPTRRHQTVATAPPGRATQPHSLRHHSGRPGCPQTLETRDGVLTSSLAPLSDPKPTL